MFSSLVNTWKILKSRGIMGINERNADFVIKYNPRRNYPLVDDKFLTKQRAIAAGIKVPELYGVIDAEHQIKNLRSIMDQHEDCVIKPAQGSGGDGIVVIAEKFSESHYKTMSGRLIAYSDLEYHVSSILTGLYSLGGMRDKALIEYRVKPDPVFNSISYEGVPDIRIIVLAGYPIMAMLRLPTRHSNSKANLHQGAIGVGMDLASGKTLRGTWMNSKIDRHPDTGTMVEGIEVPMWDECMELATSCYELVGLGYIGVDIVLDKDKGPLVLELNARPGLSIQIANDTGLAKRARMVEARIASLKGEVEASSARKEYSQKVFRPT